MTRRKVIESYPHPCARCHTPTERDGFMPDARMACGHRCYCITCYNRQQKQARRKRAEARRIERAAKKPQKPTPAPAPKPTPVMVARAAEVEEDQLVPLRAIIADKLGMQRIDYIRTFMAQMSPAMQVRAWSRDDTLPAREVDAVIQYARDNGKQLSYIDCNVDPNSDLLIRSRRDRILYHHSRGVGPLSIVVRMCAEGYACTRAEVHSVINGTARPSRAEEPLDWVV